MKIPKNLLKMLSKKNDEGLPIFDENIGRGVLDGVNTLIYTILKHFVGKMVFFNSILYDR